jgi:BirA family biotin operon repressor/biotin-[acetyl-CoA-carboxylase] ligase
MIETESSRWIVLDEVDSTNSYLMRESHSSGTVVMARRQTRGRGRIGRSWESSAGDSFIFSVLIEFSDPALFERIRFLPLLAGCSIAQAVEVMSAGTPSEGNRCFLKWPNDVFLSNGAKMGKLAGVLVETELREGRMRCVIGIGLNWRGAPPSIQNHEYESISLFPDTDREPIEFAPVLIERLNRNLSDLYANQIPIFLDEIRKIFLLTGRRVLVKGADYKVMGLSDSGELILRSESTEVELLLNSASGYTIIT